MTESNWPLLENRTRRGFLPTWGTAAAESGGLLITISRSDHLAEYCITDVELWQTPSYLSKAVQQTGSYSPMADDKRLKSRGDGLYRRRLRGTDCHSGGTAIVSARTCYQLFIATTISPLPGGREVISIFTRLRNFARTRRCRSL